MNVRFTRESGPKTVDPDIFQAAIYDDTGELSAALEAGQSLLAVHSELEMTPLHLAAAYGSSNFILAAVQQKDCGVWIADGCGRLPIEISAARKDRISQKALYGAMYPQKMPGIEP